MLRTVVHTRSRLVSLADQVSRSAIQALEVVMSAPCHVLACSTAVTHGHATATHLPTGLLHNFSVETAMEFVGMHCDACTTPAVVAEHVVPSVVAFDVFDGSQSIIV